MGGVVVLGSANMDLVVRQPRAPRPGETVFGSGFETTPGGKGLNQAVAAARAGAEVAFLGAVGADAFGDRLRKCLDAERIDTTRLRTQAGATGIAAIMVTDDGENSIVVVPGANAADEFDDDDRAVIAAASHLVSQLERPLPLLRAAFAHARAHSVTTVLTPAPVVSGAEDLLPLTDVLIANEGEAIQLSGEADTEASARHLSKNGCTVIVTLGERGCLVARDGKVIDRVSSRTVSPIDTTGAGDAFAGALVAWLYAGSALNDAVRAATLAGSIAVTRRGAAASTPSRTEIEAILR